MKKLFITILTFVGLVTLTGCMTSGPAKEVTLGKGNATVGNSGLNAGRYKLTPTTDDMTRFEVTGTGFSKRTHTVALFKERKISMPYWNTTNYTMDFKIGDTVTIESDSIKFEPVDDKMITDTEGTLTTGEYVVGKHLKSGSYTFSQNNFDQDKFIDVQVNRPSKAISEDEVVYPEQEGNGQVYKSTFEQGENRTVELKDGDMLFITNGQNLKYKNNG